MLILYAYLYRTDLDFKSLLYIKIDIIIIINGPLYHAGTIRRDVFKLKPPQDMFAPDKMWTP